MEKRKDGSELARKIRNRNEEPAELVRGLEAEGLVGFVILQTNPELKEYIEYRDAMQSIQDAKLSAQQIEGRIVVGQA
jgi:hypothetical protein